MSRMDKYPNNAAMTVKGNMVKTKDHKLRPARAVAKRTPGYNGHQYSQIWRYQ